MNSKLTAEQDAVVRHPLEAHARVLAVAGAGKTTTMVHRVKYLVERFTILPSAICILMFNRRARIQFKEKLNALLPSERQPQVHTFHSYSYSLISEAVARGYLANIQNAWVGDKEELTRIHIHSAITNLVRRKEIPPDSIDPDDAVECIGLWKNSLIPPDRAGHSTSQLLPRVYQEFERIRIEKNALTYDDFVPLAVGILEAEPAISHQVINSFDAIIVDEYQDVNFGQQRLIELIAGQRADIMVVGDDDQTIYEWRGARPRYIIGEFNRVFGNKPNLDYKLSRSFRFGPIIAQAAQNVISFNSERVTKPLIAHAGGREAAIYVVNNTSEQPTDVNKELAAQVVALVRETRDAQNIIVLARMFSQLAGLEAEFLNGRIPYRVVGRAPFFERREIVVLMDYLRLADALDQEIDQNNLNLLLSIANVPNRKISKDIIARSAKLSATALETVRKFLNLLSDDAASPLTQKQREQIDDLLAVLERLNERISLEQDLRAGDLLLWLITRLDYHAHFDNYYGSGETSEDRKRSVMAFCNYALQTKKTVSDFLRHIQTLDTTRGVPEDQQIVMTTVFRVKGEEFDYVFIPNCEEGYMPCLFATSNPIYDKRQIIAEPSPSSVIDNERRLFYVAVTRARKAVFIGTSSLPTQGSQANSHSTLHSRFIDEMQLEPTQEVMGAFQRAVRGDPTALKQLNVVAKRHAGRKNIIHNLLSEYLPSSNLRLRADVEKAIASVAPVPFAYPIQLPPHIEGNAATVKQPSASAWWDEDSEIPF